MANAAPSGQNGTRTSVEDNVITFTVGDFGFSDADGHIFTGVLFTTTPINGRLLVQGSQVAAGQFIAYNLIAEGRLIYIPNLNGSGSPFDSFTFQVRDGGGTADGGIDTDPTPNTITINIVPQPDGPVVQNFEGTANGFRVQFTEGGAPVFVDVFQNATVSDVDSANFNGGVVHLLFPTGTPDYPGYEDFSIAEGNGITVSTQAPGGVVSLDGVTFATIDFDRDGQLGVVFNDQATPARVQVLLRQLTYQLTGNDAPSGVRSPVLVIKDGSGGESVYTAIRIDLTGVDDPPVLSGLDPVRVIPPATAAAPQIIDSDVTFFEPDNPSSSGAFLQVAGLTPGDVVAIRDQGGGPNKISLVNTVIYYGRPDGFKDQIGQFSGGSFETGALTIDLSSNASPARIEQLIENLLFSNASASPAATRILKLSFSDRFGNVTSQSIEVRVVNEIIGTENSDTLDGSPHVDLIKGLGENDTLNGLAGDDVLDGGAGVDVMSGGAGNDTYIVDDLADQVIEALAGGNDLVRASVNYTLQSGTEVEAIQAFDPASADPLRLTGNAFGQTIVGNAGDNVLRGGDGEDTLRGLGGADLLIGDKDGDQLYGGAGDDIYFVDALDKVFELADEGTDRIAASESFVLQTGSSVELLEAGTLSSTVRLDLSGNELNQLLRGNNGVNLLRGEDGDDVLDGQGGDDYLVGGAGADILYGRLGDDAYYIDDAFDTIVEGVGEGRDRVAASTSFSLRDNVSVEVIDVINSTSTFAINLSGNNFGNLINGNDGANALRGGGGDDILNGFGGADTLVGDAGHDLLFGGAGNDSYFVDENDQVFELAGEGTDRVAAAGSFTLSAGSSIETMDVVTVSSTANVTLRGNDLNQTISGNIGDNFLYGEGGDDTLRGQDGNDYLIGGAGADVMIGGWGNDTYYVDSPLDVIVENPTQGIDRIATLVSYALAEGMSIEQLEAVNSTSTNDIDLTGNSFDNLLAGTFGVNVITGGGGADTLVGYAGNDMLYGGSGNDNLIGGEGADRMEGGADSDRYFVDNVGDIVIETSTAGEDVISTSVSYALAAEADIERVETTTLSGLEALNLTGNQFGTYFLGNNGANVLNGGGGMDTLEGLGGADSFVFSSALGPTNIDRIVDFVHGTDRILLGNGIFTGLPTGALNSASFVVGQQAIDSDDRIIYDNASGFLYFDADGSSSGAAIQFANLQPQLGLTASDFTVF